MTSNYNYNLGLLFEEVALKKGSNTALKYPDGTIFSYTQLNSRSNQYAHWLINQGIEISDVVGIFNNKSFEAFALMLGCIKIGAIYSNFDFTSPWMRLEKIIGTCSPKLIVHDFINGELDTSIKNTFTITTVELGCQLVEEKLSHYPTHLPNERNALVSGSNAAYIMFTSGSTGFPKGAVMSHNNVLNFIQWSQTTFKIKENDVFSNVNPIYFDNSVFDIYSALFSGAAMIPISSDLVRNGKKLVESLDALNCSFWFSVPSLLIYLLTTKVLTPKTFVHIRQIAFGGEGFSKTKLKALFDLYSERAILYNVYGPTECTCICSSHIIESSDFNLMSELTTLGTIAPNFDYLLLPLTDANQRIGELVLGGPNVGLGYYNDPDRTNVSFIQHPQKKYKQLVYKTGDLIEKRADGLLYFKGRIDNQIKHMGYRIELEEIESVVNTLDYVNETGVVYHKLNSELGEIVAFISLSKTLSSEIINLDLKKRLAPYMLPKKIIILEVLPKNKNGKIDRKHLETLIA